MFNSVFNMIPHLSTLIVTVRRNMLSSVMTTFMILAIIVTWSARGNIASWLEKNPSAEQRVERVVRGHEATQEIDGALRQDMFATSADRMLIRQYADQMDSTSQTLIPHVTTTHIVTAPGVAPPAPGIIDLPRSYIEDITGPMYDNPKNPKCIHITTPEVKNPIYHRYLEESGVAEQYVCPISDIEGAPVGLIIAGYLTRQKPRPPDEIVFAELTGTATRVAGYLAEVTAPERQTWYRKLLGS